MSENMSDPKPSNSNQNHNQSQSQQKSYKQAATDFYHRQYDAWVPWAEEQYLKWFTKDNKASYGTKQSLDQTKLTNNKQVNTLQDGVNSLVAGQVGQGGFAEPVGDAVSKDISNAEKKNGGNGPLGGYGQGAVDGVKGGVGKVGGLLGVGGGKK